METNFVLPYPEIRAQTMTDFCSTVLWPSVIPARSLEYIREFCDLYFSKTDQIFSSENTISENLQF